MGNNTRLNSNHLQILGVTNNPNNANEMQPGLDAQQQQYQSNQVVVSTSMMGRISSLKDDENLN